MRPIGSPSAVRAVTIVTPVANMASAARKSSAPKEGGAARRVRAMRDCRCSAAPTPVDRCETRTYHRILDSDRLPAAASRLDLKALHRLVAVTVLGFASGLPLALTGQAMQAWLTRRRRRHRDDRLPEPRRPAVHVQVPVGAADGPLRAAVARPAPQLARRSPSSRSPGPCSGWRRRRRARRSAPSRSSPVWSRCCRRRRTSSSTPIAPTCCRRPNAAWARRSTCSATGWR